MSVRAIVLFAASSEAERRIRVLEERSRKARRLKRAGVEARGARQRDGRSARHGRRVSCEAFYASVTQTENAKRPGVMLRRKYCDTPSSAPVLTCSAQRPYLQEFACRREASAASVVRESAP